MIKHSALFAFPLACLAILLGLVACGGSGHQATGPVTLDQAVASVRAATTPGLGVIAYEKVSSYLGIANSADYLALSAADRSDLADLIGRRIAGDNVTPEPTTYGQALQSYSATLSIPIANLDAVMTQLNNELASANALPAGVPKNELLFIAALEGPSATLGEHLSPAANLALARWFVIRFMPAPDLALAATRGACEDACNEVYLSRIAELRTIYDGIKATLVQGYEFATPEERVRIANQVKVLDRQYLEAHKQAQEDRKTCTKKCHVQ